MLQSNHLLDGSGNWDTNWARKILKIPQDQLKRIVNIAEWSTHKSLTTENIASKSVNVVTTEKQELLQSAVLEKLSQSSSSEKTIDNPKVSNLQKTTIENKLINFSTTENALSRSASLNSLNLFNKPSDHIKLRSVNSASNIKVLSNDPASVENHTISVTDLQKSRVSELSRPKCNPSEERLKDTFIFPKLKEMDQTSFSQPEMNCKSSSKIATPLEKLADRILNHKYLKGSANHFERESEEAEVCKVMLKKGMKCALDSRMMLLEKRFSPSKECCVLPTEENSKQDSHLGNTESQKLSKPILQTPKDAEFPEMQDNISNKVSDAGDMLNEDNVRKNISVFQNSVQESEINISQDKKERDVSNEHSHCISQFGTSRNHTKNEKSSTLSVNHEESFGSQLIPCGQPLPVDANLSKKANVEMLDKSTSIVTASAIAEYSGGSVTQNSPLAEIRSSGTKRKRKCKTDTPKKLKDAQNIDIHFTADQVRKMLEIMKMLHSEA